MTSTRKHMHTKYTTPRHNHVHPRNIVHLPFRSNRHHQRKVASQPLLLRQQAKHNKNVHKQKPMELQNDGSLDTAHRNRLCKYNPWNPEILDTNSTRPKPIQRGCLSTHQDYSPAVGKIYLF